MFYSTFNSMLRYKNIYYNKYLGVVIAIGFRLFPLPVICADVLLLLRFPNPIIFSKFDKIPRPFKRFFACFFFLPFPERSFITRGIPILAASIPRPFPFKAPLPLPPNFLPGAINRLVLPLPLKGIGEKR